MAISDTPDGPVETDPQRYAEHERAWHAERVAEEERRAEGHRRIAEEVAARPVPRRPKRKRPRPRAVPVAANPWGALDDLVNPLDR